MPQCCWPLALLPQLGPSWADRAHLGVCRASSKLVYGCLEGDKLFPWKTPCCQDARKSGLSYAGFSTGALRCSYRRLLPSTRGHVVRLQSPTLRKSAACDRPRPSRRRDGALGSSKALQRPLTSVVPAPVRLGGDNCSCARYILIKPLAFAAPEATPGK